MEVVASPVSIFFTSGLDATGPFEPLQADNINKRNRSSPTKYLSRIKTPLKKYLSLGH
jgi:hypothetical protein